MALNLSADVFCNVDGNKWTAVICSHPPQGGSGVEVWRKENMCSSYHAETAMEAAWRRLHREHKEPTND